MLFPSSSDVALHVITCKLHTSIFMSPSITQTPDSLNGFLLPLRVEYSRCVQYCNCLPNLCTQHWYLVLFHMWSAYQTRLYVLPYEVLHCNCWGAAVNLLPCQWISTPSCYLGEKWNPATEGRKHHVYHHYCEGRRLWKLRLYRYRW